MNKRVITATENFRNKYNCAQAVLCSYSDLIGINEIELAQISAGFGRGMGSMEGTCGAVVGAVLAANMICATNKDLANKVNIISKRITQEFKTKNQTLICKQLKGIETGQILRSCQGCVKDATEILDQILAEYQLEEKK